MIAVCISARNEADNIDELVRTIVRSGYRAIVIDDASEDIAGALAIHAGASVIRNKERLGIARSYLKAWNAALATGSDVIVQMDAGGSHSPYEIPALVEGLSDADIVIGSRFIRGATYHGRPVRALASRIAAASCNFAMPGARFSDWTSGFRAYRREALELLLSKKYYATMHPWQIEVLAQARASGLAVKEVPITYTAGRSSLGWKVIDEAIMTWLYLFFEIGSHRSKVNHHKQGVRNG